jgi:hypothetical protein
MFFQFVDGDFWTGDIFAATDYLVNKYGGDQDNHLYPKCSEVRGMVNRIIHSDHGTLGLAFLACVATHVVSSFSFSI